MSIVGVSTDSILVNDTVSGYNGPVSVGYSGSGTPITQPGCPVCKYLFKYGEIAKGTKVIPKHFPNGTPDPNPKKKPKFCKGSGKFLYGTITYYGHDFGSNQAAALLYNGVVSAQLNMSTLSTWIKVDGAEYNLTWKLTDERYKCATCMDRTAYFKELRIGNMYESVLVECECLT